MNTHKLSQLLGQNPAAAELLSIKRDIADKAIKRLPASGACWADRLCADSTARDALSELGVCAVRGLSSLDLEAHMLDVRDAVANYMAADEANPRDYIVAHEAARICDTLVSRQVFGY